MRNSSNKLTKTEIKVFNLLIEAYSYQDIADTLAIEVITVKKHVSHILAKHNCKSTLELVVNYYKSKIKEPK